MHSSKVIFGTERINEYIHTRVQINEESFKDLQHLLHDVQNTNRNTKASTTFISKTPNSSVLEESNSTDIISYLMQIQHTITRSSYIIPTQHRKHFREANLQGIIDILLADCTTFLAIAHEILQHLKTANAFYEMSLHLKKVS